MIRFDVGIIGLGAMGTAAAYSLARQGVSVAGFEQFAAGHTLGSSHGETRIIRSVYFEGVLYDPLVRAAYAAWAQLEAAAGQTFFHRTGGLDISLKQDGVFEEALAAAMAAGQPFEVLEGLALEQRFPALDLGGAGRAVYAADSGLLDSDTATGWMRDTACQAGARLHFNCAVTGWARTTRGFRLETADGAVEVRKLIIAAGSWAGDILPQLAPILIPERQVVAWYDAPGPDHANLPIFQLETREAERFYGFPPHAGQGLKLGLYHHRRERGASHIAPRGVDEADLALLRAGLDLALPGVSRTPLRAVECRFTLAPEERFLIGHMPGDKDLVVLSPCSGHGYKFMPVIGEIAASLALEQTPDIDISAFSLERSL